MRRGKYMLLVLGLLLGAGLFLSWRAGKSPKAVPNGFKVTTYSTGAAPTTLRERLFAPYFEYLLHRQRNSPSGGTNYTFNVAPTNRCSVHGLLNQCMEVSGNRYLMADGVAAASVSFGHTNVLNGVEWVAAFETALEKGQPERWDAASQKFIIENFVLVRYPEEKTILVLPPNRVEELRKLYEEAK